MSGVLHLLAPGRSGNSAPGELLLGWIRGRDHSRPICPRARQPFGPTIQRLMAERDVTYRALAHETGLSAGYLNHLVHGNRRVPSDDVIATLAKALGVEPDHFQEVRIRHIAERLERMPELIDRLYRQLG
jgi:cyanate lyase